MCIQFVGHQILLVESKGNFLHSTLRCCAPELWPVGSQGKFMLKFICTGFLKWFVLSSVCSAWDFTRKSILLKMLTFAHKKSSKVILIFFFSWSEKNWSCSCLENLCWYLLLFAVFFFFSVLSFSPKWNHSRDLGVLGFFWKGDVVFSSFGD